MHVDELFSLKGKTAVVIGGAGKIGLPVCEGLAEAGATVYIASRSGERCREAAQRLSASGLEVLSYTLDQSEEPAVQRAVREISARSGVPEILVNCAVERPMGRFFEDSFEQWDRSMVVNSRGLFITCRAFGKAMAELNRGSIITVASIYGLSAPDMSIYEGSPFQTEPDYPYTKGGMIMFSKYLASYLSPANVRVNCLAPGGFFNSQPEPFYSRYIAKVPLRRMAYHDDIKGAVVFLASPASSYITGTVIPIDGGFTAI